MIKHFKVSKSKIVGPQYQKTPSAMKILAAYVAALIFLVVKASPLLETDDMTVLGEGEISNGQEEPTITKRRCEGVEGLDCPMEGQAPAEDPESEGMPQSYEFRWFLQFKA